MTLLRSVAGFSPSRKYRLVALPLDDIRKEYADKLDHWRAGGFSTTLLDQELVKLSLKGTGTVPQLVEAWANSYIGQNDFTNRTINMEMYDRNHDDMMSYARKIFNRFCWMWCEPPYSDPSLIIYSANVHTYVGDVIYVEVQYRHGL